MLFCSRRAKRAYVKMGIWNQPLRMMKIKHENNKTK